MNIYILVKGTITVAKETDTTSSNGNKNVMFKNCASFACRKSKINNTRVDDTQYIDGIMPMFILIEYSDNYSKTSEIL